MDPRPDSPGTAVLAKLESYLPAAIAALAVALGMWLRVSDLPSLLLFGDEYHSLSLSRSDYGHILTSFDFLGSGVALPLLQRMAMDLFGEGLFGVRLPAVLGGVLGLAAMYPVARNLVGHSAAVIATLAFALSPICVFYSHFGRAYSLAVCLALVLVHAVGRASDARRASPAWFAAVALCVALLPYVHLSALPMVAAVASGALLRVAVRGGSRRELLTILASFAAGGVLLVALYLPAWQPVSAFISGHTGTQPLDLDATAIANVLSGTFGGGIVWLIASPLAALFMLRVRPESGWLLGCAALLPGLSLVVSNQVAGVFGQSRYLITSVPFLLMLLSWGLVQLVRGARRERRPARLVEIGLGAVLVLANTAFGPLSPGRPDPGPFANTYLGLRSLPEFDVPFEQTPPFYAELAAAEPVRIIEAPALLDRSLLLYRNYYLQHRKETWLGFLGWELPPGVSGPFVAVMDAEGLAASGARYLVLHLDVEDELRNYLDAVARDAAARGRGPEAATFPGPLLSMGMTYRIPSVVLELLRDRLGDPLIASDGLLVWELMPDLVERMER